MNPRRGNLPAKNGRKRGSSHRLPDAFARRHAAAIYPPSLFMKKLLLPSLLALLALAPALRAAEPLKVLLLTGGCCHDYAAQKDILKEGLEKRANVVVTQIHSDDKGTKPIAIQGSYGLGRVTVVAFDLDRAPLNEWTERSAFWENMLNQAGYVLPTTGSKLEKYGNKNDEYATALQGSLDFFEGVPVVSFGWVALFILIYIVLIGPVDYLFPKKVVKRLRAVHATDVV